MKRQPFEPLDLLRRLGDEYRHIQQEHHREPPHSATRRRLGERQQTLEQHFERLLVEWTPDEALRAAWREFLYGRGPAPGEPRVALPPLFKGRSDAGALVEVCPAPDGYDIFVDSVRSDHTSLPWNLEPEALSPVLVGEHLCDEVFDAPPEALAALTEFLARRAEPPWRWARELLEDGLIDPELALTPRGRRYFARARPAEAPPPRGRNHCVLVADAARARLLVLDVDRSELGPPTSALREVADLNNPMLRAHDVDAVSDNTGRPSGARPPLHTPPDHRDQRRRDIERHFAVTIAEQAAAMWRHYAPCNLVVVANPTMLGLLRPAIQRELRAKEQVEIHELARDLTKLSAPMLHDRLAEAALLPARGRRPPLEPVPGLPT